MKRFRLARVSTVALLACLPIAALGAARSGPQRRVPAPVDPEVRSLVERINRHRAERGCRALTWDSKLASIARRHSEDMVRRRFFSHTNPSGQDPFDRLHAAGVRYRAAAENLAEGQLTGDQTFSDWMSSPGHRRNLEDCEYTHLGVGLDRNRWTLLLVRYP